MTTLSRLSYVNPFSKQHNAITIFKNNLNIKQKVATVAISVFVTLFTLGILTAPVFRNVVYRFKAKKITDSPTKIRKVADKISPNISKNRFRDTYSGDVNRWGNPDGIGTLSYKNGGVYAGELKQGIPHGQGTMIYHKKEIKTFTGAFEGGIPKSGTLTYSNGNKYIGEFENSLPNGSGQLFIKETNKKKGKSASEEYKGEFQNGIYHGFGTLLNDTLSYVGNFVCGLYNGQGQLESENESYQGYFKNGLYHGEGRLTLNSTKSVLIGTFKEGFLSGNGQINYHSGLSYVGEIKLNEPNGKGILSNGNHRYEGSIKDGVFHGQGEISQSNTPTTFEDFKNYFAPPSYLMIPPIKNCSGEFQLGLLHGKGSIEFYESTRHVNSNKEPNTYIGNFKYGKFDGEGLLTLNDTIYKGTFRNGNFPSGTITYPNGDIYEGEANNGVPNGTGTLNGKDGSKFTGVFLNGKKQGNGTYLYPEKDERHRLRYTGMYKDDNQCGHGELKYRKFNGRHSSSLFKGIFNNDLPKTGTLTKPTGESLNVEYDQNFHEFEEINKNEKGEKK